MSSSPYSLGFTTLTSEIDVPKLACHGQVPNWLNGSLIRTGPAKFEVGAHTYQHWFDGLAMLHRFSFDNGRVSYANRYLHGESYRSAMEYGTIQRTEFATRPEQGLLQKALPFLQPKPGDNGNVNISRFGEDMVAMTETPTQIRFDRESLETLGPYRHQSEITGQITTAHPQYDNERRCQYNYLLEFGRTSKYHLYSMSADAPQQKLVATIPVQNPAYMHSFGMSSHYLILTEFPLVVNPLHLLLGRKPFIQNYRWEPQRGTIFHIVDKDSGHIVKTARSEPFFAFHHVNAFERDNEVLVDIIAFPDSSVIDHFYLEHLRSDSLVTATGQLKRFRIDLGADDEVSSQTLTESALEFPRINYRDCAMRPYRYMYAAGSRSEDSFIDHLVKLDIETGATLDWYEAGCYPGEPVFVGKPQAEAEDQGVVLSVILDTTAGASFLLVLNASTFAELARVPLPHHIPFGFHGNFYQAADA